MKWLSWAIRNLLRNRLRTFLTCGSVAVSLFLLAMITAAYRFLEAPATSERTHLLLVVSPRTAMTNRMPLWYKHRIAALAGVGTVSPFGYLGAQYGGSDAFIAALAFDPEAVFDFFPDWNLPADERQGFVREKKALIAGRKKAEKYGWKVGDRIHLASSMFSRLGSLEFVIGGIYTSAGDSDAVVFHWDYLNEALERPDQAHQFWVLARSADDVPRLTKAIDAAFRDEPVETRTDTLKQVMLDFLNLLGNVKLILLSISAALFFAVLLVVANTMAMSIRERTPEIATLRAMGFAPARIRWLLAAESALISLAGALLGCLGASILTHFASRFVIGGAMPARLQVDSATLALVVVAALGISLASTLVPAYRASRVNIAQGLRFIG